jgi:hypothetical protein
MALKLYHRVDVQASVLVTWSIANAAKSVIHGLGFPQMTLFVASTTQTEPPKAGAGVSPHLGVVAYRWSRVGELWCWPFEADG